MANPLYGQNKADNAIDYSRSKVIVTSSAAAQTTTLTAADSGATILLNAATGTIQLPDVKPGLNYKIIIGVESTAGCDIKATAGTNGFFGLVRMGSDTADQVGVPQQITYAAAKAAPGSYDVLDFVAATSTIGGMAGDFVKVTGIDNEVWFVEASITTSDNNPGTCAVIVAA